MVKYIDADKLKSIIKAQIKERKEWMKDIDKPDRQDQLWSDLNGEDVSILQIIDSLQQEKPEVDLEKALSELDDAYFDLDGIAVQGATYYLTVEDLKGIACHFYELGKTVNNMDKVKKIRAKIDRMLDDICEADGYVQKKDEPRYDALAEVLDFLDTLSEEPDKSLEEAAEEYEKEHTYQRYDGGGLTPEYNATLAEAFVAGAEWQEKRNEETIKTAEDHAFLAGADWQKEQMMKEAVEVKVQTSPLNGPLGISAYCSNFPHTHQFYNCKDGDKVKLIIVKDDEE